MRFAIPPVVKNLLILNGLLFFITWVVKSKYHVDLVDSLGLYYYKSPHFKPYQLVTHVFMHGSFIHIFSNMFALFMFGTALEHLWGGRKLLVYYFVTAFGAAALHMGVTAYEMNRLEQDANVVLNHPEDESVFKAFLNQHPEAEQLYAVNYNMPSLDFVQQYTELKRDVPTVGASGAVFGLLLAFGVLFPNELIYLYFMPWGLKAKYFVALYGLFELYQGLQNNPSDNVAHFAHLGGMLFGGILLYWWRNKKYNQQL